MAHVEKRAYAEMYGPTIGDRVRLADTDLFLQVEADYITRSAGYGEEVKFGGGKTIRDGMAQSQRTMPNRSCTARRLLEDAQDCQRGVCGQRCSVSHWGLVRVHTAMA